MRVYHPINSFLLCLLGVFIFAVVCHGQKAEPLPEGLFNSNAIIRVETIKMVETQRITGAIAKLESMVADDESAEVRAAACHALGVLGNKSHVKVLEFVLANDESNEVQLEARTALFRITGEEPTENSHSKASVEDAQTSDDSGATNESTENQENSEMPTLMKKEPTVQTRRAAVGVGSMGGYGLAAVNVRIRIPTKSEQLPWVGIEIGGGWTPPKMYPVISGYTKPVVTGDNIRWKLISGAAGVLFYLHRNHYIPLRGGFDIGQGPYGMLGYGYEHLNMEGFFSWGIEVGILGHSISDKWAKKIMDENDLEDLKIWPVVPYLRFVLHFYLA